MICCKEIDEYIKFFEENPDETDDEIKLLIKNIIKPTLSRDDVFFDGETFQKAIRFCEKWFYKLFPYQKFIYALFFIYKNDTKDTVLFREIFILMGRGNGKDGMIMPLACFFLTSIIYKINNSKYIDIPMKKYMKTENENDIDFTYWCQANPSLRYRPTLQEEMINDYIDMQSTPSYKSEFYAKRMNLPQQDEELSVTSWDNIKRASYSDVENEIPRETGDVKGKSAVVGLDFASLNDFASAGFLFKINDEYIWRQRTWICARSKFFNEIKFPFDNIGQEGFQDFEVVNQDSISGRDIIMWILSEMDKYNIKKIVLDTYRYKLLEQIFKEFGVSIETKDNPYGLVRMIKYPASIAAIVAPRIEVAFSEGKINIGNSAIMRWSINNTSVKDGKDGNKKYEKIEPKLRKNDPFMAFVAAMSVQELLDEDVIYV